jgi:hypothetical protein
MSFPLFFLSVALRCSAAARARTRRGRRSGATRAADESDPRHDSGAPARRGQSQKCTNKPKISAVFEVCFEFQDFKNENDTHTSNLCNTCSFRISCCDYSRRDSAGGGAATDRGRDCRVLRGAARGGGGGRVGVGRCGCDHDWRLHGRLAHAVVVGSGVAACERRRRVFARCARGSTGSDRGRRHQERQWQWQCPVWRTNAAVCREPGGCNNAIAAQRRRCEFQSEWRHSVSVAGRWAPIAAPAEFAAHAIPRDPRTGLYHHGSHPVTGPPDRAQRRRSYALADAGGRPIIASDIGGRARNGARDCRAACVAGRAARGDAATDRNSRARVLRMAVISRIDLYSACRAG